MMIVDLIENRKRRIYQYIMAGNRKHMLWDGVALDNIHPETFSTIRDKQSLKKCLAGIRITYIIYSEWEWKEKWTAGQPCNSLHNLPPSLQNGFVSAIYGIVLLNIMLDFVEVSRVLSSFGQLMYLILLYNQ